jgi:Ataxin-3
VVDPSRPGWVQRGALCGVHCLNNLLQGPCFTARVLANIADEFDESEKILMAQHGFDTPEYRRFLADGSGNRAGDGMFSIQVRFQAFERINQFSY